jgi:NADH-quinone oxidoreductase subunit A
MTDYLPILVMLVLASVFAAASFAASGLLAPRRPTAAKTAPYECGIVPEHEPVERFPVKFYLVAMAFIIFDIELVFLYPWAVVFRRLGIFGLAEMGLFGVPLVVAYAYLLSSGALEWGPARRVSERLAQPVRRAGRGETPTEGKAA